MQVVWFRCTQKNTSMFHLNAQRELNYVPIVGDIIKTSNEDFHVSSFRVKPWFSYKEGSSRFRNSVGLDFVVVSRNYDLRSNEWELICEPTSESLLRCLKNVKVK